MNKSKKTTSPFICQECGAHLESPNTPHNYYDCGKYHLKRAYEILREVMVVHTKDMEPIVFKKKGE